MTARTSSNPSDIGRSSWASGQNVAGAAALAVDRVNSDETLLPGRHLEYSWGDSGCSAKQGLKVLRKLISKRGELDEASTVDAVVGPGCSVACTTTSHMLTAPQISWGCSHHFF